MLELFLLLAVCFTPTTSIHCEEDIDLDDVQQYSLNIFDAGNIEYWRTSQNNFQTYGKFVGNPKKSIVKGTYYVFFVEKNLILILSNKTLISWSKLFLNSVKFKFVLKSYLCYITDH